VVTSPGCRLRQDSAFFFRSRSQKFVKNRTWSHFSFSAAARVCVVFKYCILKARTLMNFGCIGGSPSLSRSRFSNLKIFRTRIRIDSKILEQKRSLKITAGPAFQKSPQFKIALGPESENLASDKSHAKCRKHDIFCYKTPTLCVKKSKSNKQRSNRSTKFEDCERILKLLSVYLIWRLFLPKTLTFPDERIPFQTQKKATITVRIEHSTMGQ